LFVAIHFYLYVHLFRSVIEKDAQLKSFAG